MVENYREYFLQQWFLSSKRFAVFLGTELSKVTLRDVSKEHIETNNSKVNLTEFLVKSSFLCIKILQFVQYFLSNFFMPKII